MPTDRANALIELMIDPNTLRARAPAEEVLRFMKFSGWENTIEMAWVIHMLYDDTPVPVACHFVKTGEWINA